MKNVFILYVITQLVTTAYGLAVIESTRPFVESKLIDQGYHKNKNSLYRFNNTASNILKGFIPFYYLIKSLKITMRKGDVSNEVMEQIKSKNYVLDEEEIEEEIPTDVKVIEDIKEDDLVNSMNIAFEKPEKYTARKNNISLLDTYETPIEYEEKQASKEDDLELSPFVNNEKVVEQVLVKEEVTNKDIAKAICDLDLHELVSLREKIAELEEIKKNNKELKLEKDVA